MRSSAVIEFQISADRCARLADRVVGAQIDLLIFEASLEPLDEDVVAPCALAVHADRDAVADQQSGCAQPG
jgi:hypothetical protein